MLEKISKDVNVLSQCKLNVRTVTKEINQYDDLLKLFLDPPQQYDTKIE